MASPANPVASTMARGIIDSLVSGGRAGAPIPQPSGARPPEMASSMLGSQIAELRQADPDAIKRALNEIKKQIVQLIPQAAFTIPGMNKHLPNLLKTVDSALQEIEKASNILGAVGGAGNGMGGPGPGGGTGPGAMGGVNPIQSSMANPSPAQPAAGTFPF